MKKRARFPRPRARSGYLAVTLVVVGPLLLPTMDGTASATSLGDPDPEIPVTYARDIAPILQRSCQICHNPQGIGPMSLMSYEEVRPWARVIKLRVEERVMPPWHLDRTVGIQDYENDISLSDEQIATIAEWVEMGALEGDPNDLPAPLALPDPDAWAAEADMGRPPDLVIRSEPHLVKARSMDSWPTPSSEFDALDRPRWVMAAEFKPLGVAGRRVAHHGHLQLVQTERDGRRTVKGLARHGVGKSYDVYPEGTGMYLEPGGTLSWNLHYAAIGEDVEAVVEVGLWFHPEDEPPAMQTLGEQRFTAGSPDWGHDIVIAPHSVRVQQGTYVLDRAAMIATFRAHMHMRGREQSLEVIYPDGRRELLSKTDRYDHLWQLQYQYADHAIPLLPKGSVLLITTTFDNTAENPRNPDPDQWVVFGQRGVDEMAHAWLGLTYLTDEQYEEAMAQRRADASSVAND
ncbi:MAG: cytochrome c [Gemmatimonadota bacterium]